jgi:formate hydrogenlyase transcriptional activator
VSAEGRWYDPERVRHSGLRSVLCVPLLYEGAPIGVLGMDSPRFTAATPPTASELARLRALAAQAAIGVSNARLYEAAEMDRQRLRRLVEERRQLRNEVGHLRTEVRQTSGGTGIVGRSPRLREVLAQVELVAPADSTVIIVGETGTGKELIARSIHEQSRRSTKPFIAVNCAALPEHLVESELFGHEKGAFTGALTRKPGKFELAHTGTIFLDEIGDLPLDAQSKLLRVLQDREVHRVGAVRGIPVNVRVVAATNQDLAAGMQQGRFRADLYYRLSVFPISLPPLRERTDDIPLLVDHFVQLFATRQHKRVPRMSPAALERMMSYPWPGNIRELQNVVERAVILTSGSVIPIEAIPLGRVARPRPALPADLGSAGETPAVRIPHFSEAERNAIIRALEQTGWRISGQRGAADLLGLKPTTLHAKMKKLGIRRPSPTEFTSA